MAWTAPLTATANTALDASDFNASVRDNLNETMPGLATDSGTHFVATGANAIAERATKTARIDTGDDTSSTTYVKLSGPSVSVDCGTQMLVHIAAVIRGHETGGQSSFVSIDISGATTRDGAANESDGIRLRTGGLNDALQHMMRAGAFLVTGLTAGTHTVEMVYRVGSSTTTYQERVITVFPL